MFVRHHSAAVTLSILAAAVILWTTLKLLDPPPPVDVTSLEHPDASKPATSLGKEVTPSPISFTNVAQNSGIDFVYYGGPGPQGHMIEQNGGGIALLDYDRDGVLDIFFSNGSRFDEPASGRGQTSHFYRAVGTLAYENISLPAHLDIAAFGQGCAAGDFDNDGFMDLFLACYGPNHLWRNNGDGTFTELPARAESDDTAWSTSAAFADFDADGNSDLYVVNYVDWTPDAEPYRPREDLDINLIRSPVDFSGQPDLLYHNKGDGTFAEAGNPAGIAIAGQGKGLALAVADYDADTFLDVFVANDTTGNFLFLNDGAMHFKETAVPLGAAISSDGVIGASMGVATFDFDRNGLLDLCVTNFQNQINDLYVNLGPAGFIAANTSSGLDLHSRSPLSFGIAGADFDLDGWCDLFVANGHIWNLESLGTNNEYKMRPSLFRNEHGRRLREVGASGDAYISQRWLGRSVARGDLDNDGDTDLVVLHLLDQPAILRNDSSRVNDSMRLEIIGTFASRCPGGTLVSFRQGRETQVAQVPSGGSFHASHDHRLIFAATDSNPSTTVSVTWPSGIKETWASEYLVNRTWQLIEGTGTRNASDEVSAKKNDAND